MLNFTKMSKIGCQKINRISNNKNKVCINVKKQDRNKTDIKRMEKSP